MVQFFLSFYLHSRKVPYKLSYKITYFLVRQFQGVNVMFLKRCTHRMHLLGELRQNKGIFQKKKKTKCGKKWSQLINLQLRIVHLGRN